MLVVRNSAPPLMRGALMSARYDMEVGEPDTGQLRERVQLTAVTSLDIVDVPSFSDARLGSNGRVA